MSNIYLNRYAWQNTELDHTTINNPDLIVVIPAHQEPNLDRALASIHHCDPPNGEVLIIVVINESENDEDYVNQANLNSLKQAEEVKRQYAQAVIQVTLPAKKAGVGLARKIGMDEAVRIFEANGKDGIIVCYDADCTCDPNYLQVIEETYTNKEINLGLVHYEHALNGINKQAIVDYELYLRYYINALRVVHYPHALQTLGSCITVRNSAYQKQGGMNQRKAGEDFYFIHKLITLGGIIEINQTTIYPSDRTSERVPFGTGHAIGKYLSDPDPAYPVYHHQTFHDLRTIPQNLHVSFETGKVINLPKSIDAFHQAFDFDLAKIIKASGSFRNFTQRYYQWWDGFRVLKYVHFCRDHFYPKIPLADALNWLNDQIKDLDLADKSKTEQLIRLRKYDREQMFYIK